MKIVADLHLHTVASGHAYGTITEMAFAAKKAGLEAIGVTDHGPKMYEGAHNYHFCNLASLPRQIEGVKIYRGAEANITTKEGKIDLWRETQKILDFIIASMHNREVSPCGLSKEENTLIWQKLMQNPFVKILGHPENSSFPINVAEFVAAAKKNKKIIEVNNASFFVRVGSQEIMKQILREAKNQKALLIVNSDAHFTDKVGVFSEVLAMLKELQIPEELIINTSLAKLEKELNINFN